MHSTMMTFLGIITFSLVDHTNGRAYATVLCPSVCRL